MAEGRGAQRPSHPSISGSRMEYEIRKRIKTHVLENVKYLEREVYQWSYNDATFTKRSSDGRWSKISYEHVRDRPRAELETPVARGANNSEEG